MLKIDRKKYPYRRAVLGIITDNDGNFLLVKKQSYKENEWSFAGGGIEKNETAQQAVLRELKEELGSELFSVIAKSTISYNYEWPDEAILRSFEKKGELYRGVLLEYFLIKFLGNKEDLKLQKDEIKVSKWVNLKELPSHLIFPKQWETIKRVIEELM